MKKSELIEKITGKVEGMTKKDAGIILDVFSEVITEALVAGDEVTIPNVGKLSTVEKPEKTGTIQLGERKGETYVSPAHRAPKFKVATALKNAVK